jgi:hypothetical protein
VRDVDVVRVGGGETEAAGAEGEAAAAATVVRLTRR